MSFDVNQFRAALNGDGARPNLFQVNLHFPEFVNNSMASTIKNAFLCHGTSLPAATMQDQNVFYMGRQIPQAGGLIYNPWNLQIYNDEDFMVRDALMAWMRGMSGDTTSTLRDVSAATMERYSVNASVIQYSKMGMPIKAYDMIGLFPIHVGEIQLSWQANDQIEEFSADFRIQGYRENQGLVATAGAIASSAIGILGQFL